MLLHFLNSWRSEWWARRTAELTATYAAQEAALKEGLQARVDEAARQQQDVAYLERTQQERKVALAAANEDLHTQLRLLEAKAAPDHVWAEAFSLGFSKAWEMMAPLMTDGVRHMEEHIRTTAINETLANLATTHQLVDAKDIALRSTVELLKKREEFAAKAQAAQGAAGEKYRHYLTALDWLLSNGH